VTRIPTITFLWDRLADIGNEHPTGGVSVP
jgi:hypothetical protein